MTHQHVFLFPVVPSMVETTALGAAMAAGAAEGIGVWDMKSASSTIGVTQYKPDMPEKRKQNIFFTGRLSGKPAWVEHCEPSDISPGGIISMAFNRKC